MTPPPWLAGRRVLVLGASGFVGRWAAAAFAAAGADVVASARTPDAARAVLAAHALDLPVHRCDVEREGDVEALVAAVAPDVVVNVAGYGVRPEERDPARAAAVNALLPERLGRALLGRPADAASDRRPELVHVGSAAEYGDAGGDLRESGPALPQSVYGRTKLAGTQALARLAEDEGLRCVVVRAFTVYGPGEPPGRLLPTLIAAAAAGRPSDLTEGLQRRDFTYVEDVAEALVRLAAVPAPAPPVVNAASGTLLAVREFVERAADVLGIERAALRFGAIANTREEMVHGPVNTESIVRLVGWRPATSVADGVRRTLARLAEWRQRSA